MTVPARPKAASKKAKSVEKAHFEIFRGKRGDYRVRFTMAGEVIFSSEGHISKQHALKAIDALRAGAATADVIRESTADMKGSRPTLIEHILSGPEWPEEMYEEVNRRAKNPSRPPIDF